MSIDKQALLQMIADHVTTNYKEIRYGDSSQPRGVMDALVIRRQPTAGGVQYSIREVSIRGEGSGMYEPTPDKIVDIADKIVTRYMQPHPNPIIREMLEEKRKPLSFYVVSM